MYLVLQKGVHMGRNGRQLAKRNLINLYNKHGYITFDQIIECIKKLSLPIADVDWLTNSLTIKNIIIYESDPSKAAHDKEDYEDYAQVNYDEIYYNVIKLDNSLEPFISEIRNIIPPQYGEMSRLIYLSMEGNEHARSRIIELHLRVAVRIAYQNAISYDMDIVDTLGAAC